MDLWSFLQCFSLLHRTVHDGSESFCQGDSAIQKQERNDIIARAPPEGRPRMDFSSIGSGKIGQPKVIKVWMAYYRYDPPVIDELRVEVIGWEGSKGRDMKILKYDKVKDMDGGKDAIAKFKPTF